MARFILFDILVELCLVLALFGYCMVFVCETFEHKAWASIAFVVYLCLPDTIRFFPIPKYTSLKTFDKEAQALEHESISWEKATEPCGGPTHEQYVIIGGSGFLGRRIVHALYLRGETKIRVIDVDERAMAEMIPLYEKTDGKSTSVVTFVKADVTNYEEILAALKDANCVFAPFAVIRFWEHLRKHWSRSFKVNVDGTKNVLEACAKLGVRRVVVTTSSSVVETWPGNLENGISDSSPRCDDTNYLNNYCISKSIQESIALRANGKKGMAIGAIRPCSGVYGYGDKLVLGGAVAGGFAPAISACNTFNFVQVDSIVLAHLLLEKRLRNGPKDKAAGEAFCITGGEAISEGAFAKLIVNAGRKYGMNIRFLPVPVRAMCILTLIISVIEFVYPGNTASILGKELSILTFTTLLTSTHSIVVSSNDRARDILGYRPHLSVASGVDRTMHEYAEKRIIF